MRDKRRFRWVGTKLFGALLVFTGLALPPAASADTLYWANNPTQSIARANTDGTGVDIDFVSGAGIGPRRVAVNESHVYWVQSSCCGAIGRANIDGSDPEPFFLSSISADETIRDLAVNESDIFWTASDSLVRFVPIGSNDYDFIPGNGFSSHGIAVNDSHIYWAGEPQSIARADLDGSNPNNAFITDADFPRAIALNSTHMFWTTNNGSASTIRRADLNGQNATEIVSDTGNFDADGLAVDGSHVYWANATDDTIGRADLDGGNPEPAFLGPADGVDGPSGLAVLAEPVTGHELSVTKTGGGSGTVASSPAGIDCGSTCSADFSVSQVVNLSAVAASGSNFSGWSGACTGTGACQVTMSEARSVSAAFEPEPNACLSTGSGLWSSAGTWTNCGGGIPGPEDFATVTSDTGPHFVSAPAGVDVEPGTLRLLGTGTLTITGAGTFAPTSIELVSGTLDSRRNASPQSLTLEQGVLTNDHTITPESFSKTDGTTMIQNGADVVINGAGSITGGTIGLLDSAGDDPSLAVDDPSLQANGPLTIDAAASGSPILTTDGGDVPHFFINSGGSLSLNGATSKFIESPTRIAGGSLNVGNGQTVTLSRGSDQTAGTTTVASGGTLNRSPFPGVVYTQSGGTTTIAAGGSSTATFGSTISGGTLTVDGTLASAGTPVTLTGPGTLAGTGTVSGEVTNTSGTVAPGNSPGTLAITGNYNQGAAGTLAVEVDGTTPGTQFDRLTVSGTATVDGTVAVDRDPGFEPASPDTFEFLSAGNRVGTFSTLAGGGGLSGGRSLELDHPPNAARLVLTPQHTLTVTTPGGGTITSTPAGINCGATCSADFNEGQAVTLTASSDAGAAFAGWSGCDSTTGTLPNQTCDVAMSADKSITATFNRSLSVGKRGAGSGTVTSFPAGIDCGSTCAADFIHGTLVELTATAAPGSSFTGWSASDGSPGICSGTGTCEVMMTQARSVSANFALPQHNLTAVKDGTGSGTVTSTPGGISCGATCSANFDEGQAVSLSAVAGGTSSFAGWSGSCTGTGPCSVTMSQARSVTATFTLNTFNLEVAKTGAGSGTVTSLPTGIDCGSDCSEIYGAGQVVTLTPAAVAGSAFTGWSGACSGTGDCQVTMNAARSVGADFAITRTLTVTTPGGGTITSNPAGLTNCGSTCSAEFNEGQQVVLTANPSSGATLRNRTGCDSTTATTCTLTMNANRSVSYIFSFPLTVAKAGTGAGTVTSSPAGIDCGADCSESFDAGQLVTLSQAATGGSEFTGWSGACSGLGACQVTMSQVRNVNASFSVRSLTITNTGGGTVTSSPAGINCGSTCKAGFAHGQVVVLTATPSGDASFQGWTGCDSQFGNSCTVTVDAHDSVSVRFKVALNVIKAGPGSGTVTSSPAHITCGSTCAATNITFGSEVRLFASPAPPSSSFGGWSGACTGTGICTVTMDQARSVTATFTLDSFSLSVVKTGAGQGTVTSSPAGIDCGSDCSGDYGARQPVTLTPAAAAGSSFVRWSGAGAGCSRDSCRVTMNQALSVGAHFVPDADNDIVDDAFDNCLGINNPLQRDSDGDRVGNACDSTGDVTDLEFFDGPINAFGLVTTDYEGDGATAEDQIETQVVSPNAGHVMINESSLQRDGGAFTLRFDITAPEAPVLDPLWFIFTLDSSLFPDPNGAFPAVERNGVVVPPCVNLFLASAVPDPCIHILPSSPGSDRAAILRTSRASLWTMSSTGLHLRAVPRLKVDKGGVATVRATCLGESDCRTKLQVVLSKQDREIGKAKAVLGTARVALKAGRSAKVRVQLGPRAVRLLRAQHRLDAQIRFRSRDHLGNQLRALATKLSLAK